MYGSAVLQLLFAFVINLLVGTHDNDSQPLACIHDSAINLLYLGVIDFLQNWNCSKVCAMTIKVCERNKSTVSFGRLVSHDSQTHIGATRSVWEALSIVF